MEAYREHALGADLSLDTGPLRIRSELALRLVAYDEGKRPLYWEQPGVYTPDYTAVDWYALAAYLLPWGGLEPFVYVEALRWPSPLGEGLGIASAGLNVHFSAGVQLKMQHAFHRAFSDFGHLKAAGDDIQTTVARLVLAF